MNKQLLQSGTAVSALAREAESKLNSIHKLAITQKEYDETLYWLEFLQHSQFISKKHFKFIILKKQNF